MAPLSKRFRSAPSPDRRSIDPDSLALPPTDLEDDATVVDDGDVLADESLRSFVFEVSAGRRHGVADATDAPSPHLHAAASARPRLKLIRARRRAKPVLLKPEGATTSTDESTVFAPGDDRLPQSAPDNHHSSSSLGGAAALASRDVISSAELPKPPARVRRRRRLMPAWSASLAVHVAMVSLLATVGLATIERPDELAMFVTPAETEDLLYSESELPPTEGDADFAPGETTTEIIDPGLAAHGDQDSAAALSGVLSDSIGPNRLGPPGPSGNGTGGPIGEMGRMFGGGGTGLGKFGSGLGDAPTARFFGKSIEGRRIVFVLDNSGSMQEGRLETVIAELLRCVDSLADNQEFYVIFHSDTIYPLFYPDPVDRYIRPTEANKRMLARWLDTVELCLGDSVDEALAAAAMIEPDTVFLLSDGRIQGTKKIRFLLDGRSRNFPIHTFAVGIGSSVAGRRNLEEVAAANGGDFSESDVPDAMRDLARKRPRPYHSEVPGPVWGQKVKPFFRSRG